MSLHSIDMPDAIVGDTWPGLTLTGANGLDPLPTLDRVVLEIQGSNHTFTFDSDPGADGDFIITDPATWEGHTELRHDVFPSEGCYCWSLRIYYASVVITACHGNVYAASANHC